MDEFEAVGTLHIFGLKIITGLYATNKTECQEWIGRIPSWLKIILRARIEWALTWTTSSEYRDASGALRRMDQRQIPEE